LSLRALATGTIMGIPKNLLYMAGMYIFFNYVIN
jgi:hypothetical protein